MVWDADVIQELEHKKDEVITEIVETIKDELKNFKITDYINAKGEIVFKFDPAELLEKLEKINTPSGAEQ